MSGVLATSNVEGSLRSSARKQIQKRPGSYISNENDGLAIVSTINVDSTDRAREDVNEDGTHAAAHLDIAHYALAAQEGEVATLGPPSDRWYRLYDQMERFTSPAEVYILASALFLVEVEKIRQRSDRLPRRDGRAELRNRVARQIDAATRIAETLLLQVRDEDLFIAPVVSVDGDTCVDRDEEPDPEPHSIEVSGRLRDANFERDDELNRLAVLASRGDQRALELLLARIRPMVVQYCRARIGPETLGTQSAEDIAQDTLMAVVGALQRWQPDKRVMAFVYGIASNKVVDAYRAAGRDRSVPTDDVPDGPDIKRGPEQTAVSNSVVAELRTLLDALPTQHREILVLRVALGMSAVETAAAIGSTVGAVRVAQHRAIGKLRDMAERHNTVAEHIRIGHAQLASRTYSEAAESFTAALAEEPSRAEAHFGLALALLQGRRPHRHGVATIRRVEGHLQAAAELIEARVLELLVAEDYRLAWRQASRQIPPYVIELTRELSAERASLLLVHVPAPEARTWRAIEQTLGRWR